MRFNQTGKFATIISLCLPFSGHADGNIVDKIYHPYVQPLEREIEWRGVFGNGNLPRGRTKGIQRLGIGRSVSEQTMAEIYLIGESARSNDFSVDATEFEIKTQLTEQGEYAADWGSIVELERNFRNNSWEATAGLIGEMQQGRWLGTANLFVLYEAGEHIRDELESRLSLQARYRLSPRFEPALEFYTGQNRRGIGPVFMGKIGLGGRRKLLWETGVIYGLMGRSPDRSVRALLEYEF